MLAPSWPNLVYFSVESDIAENFVKHDTVGEESEEEVESDRQHEKLLDAISSLSSTKRIARKQRKEPVSSASEFHASGSQEKLQLHELVGAIQSSSSNADLKKHLSKIEKNEKVLAVPLPKHEKEKIERTVAYEKTCKDLKKWDSIVQKNRKADQLQFPLQQPDIRLINNTRQSLKSFQPRTPLEQEIATLLHGSDHVLPNNKVLTRAEERALKAMSLEEAKARRAELQKHRALLSYKEAKSKRAKKIKSKRYHRILRKEKLKLEKKTLEELEKTDPEGYLEKLQQLDRQRMQERMNLKHRGGSKYMKRQAVYAKFDDNARQSVQDMIQKNKELTQKLVQEDEDELEVNSDGEKTLESDMTTDDIKNPWMSATSGKRKSSVISRPEEIINTEAVKLNAELEQDKEETKASEVEEVGMDEYSDNKDIDDEKEILKSTGKAMKEYHSIDDIFTTAERDKLKSKQLERKVKKQIAKEKKEQAEARRLERLQQRKKQVNKIRKGGKRSEDSEDSGSSDSDTESEKEEVEELKDDIEDEGQKDDGLMTSLQRKNKLEDFEGAVDKIVTITPDLTAMSNNSKRKNQSQNSQSERPGNQSKEVKLDPSKYFTVETSVKHLEASDLVEEGEELIAENQQRLTIAQAFASDDIVEEFQAEKQELEEKDKPKDIDLSLPGWGEWGGSGVEPSKKKRRRFLIKAPKAHPRKDRNLSNVIISETKDNSIAKHQVSQLPFPFTNVHEFQNSIRQPIGRTWVPETSYKDMIQPRVTTKLGTIIDPISKEETFKNSKNKDFTSKTDSSKSEKQSEGARKSHSKNRKRTKQAK